MDFAKIVEAFPSVEEREFLFEMIEPELFESHAALEAHRQEGLDNVEDVEAWTNNMGRQQRRIVFIKELYNCLERGVLNE